MGLSDQITYLRIEAEWRGVSQNSEKRNGLVYLKISTLTTSQSQVFLPFALKKKISLQPYQNQELQISLEHQKCTKGNGSWVRSEMGLKILGEKAS